SPGARGVGQPRRHAPRRLCPQSERNILLRRERPRFAEPLWLLSPRLVGPIIRWPANQIDHLTSVQEMAKDGNCLLRRYQVPTLNLDLIEFKVRVSVIPERHDVSLGTTLIPGGQLDAAAYVEKANACAV